MENTLNTLFMNTVQAHWREDFLSSKVQGRYVPISTETFARRVRECALGLHELGVDKNDKVILLADDTPDWVMMDYAVLGLGAVSVPIYTSLTPEQIQYIINDSDARTIFCTGLDLYGKLESILHRTPAVKNIVFAGESCPTRVLPLENVLAKGRDAAGRDDGLFKRLALSVRGEDIASIVYTSGTTGIPKGVLLTHANFSSNVDTLASLIPFNIKDTSLSFLPLSHVLARMVTFAFLSRGTAVAFAESPETVAENMIEVKPTIMVSVPRLFEKIYGRIMDNVLQGSSLKKKIFFWALRTGQDASAVRLSGGTLNPGLRIKKKIAHRLVFSKVIAKTGGRVRFFVSGGAPLAKDIAEFFSALGFTILEGYGLTETAPVISVNTFEHTKFGTVGRPIPGVEVRIAEDGEILVRGPNVMKGYYKKEEETAEVLKGGWLYTGDIGHLDDEGFLVISDRKKDIIITSGGKNIAPQPIENLLKQNPYISNALIVGSNRKYIVALIVPDFDKLEEMARRKGITYTNHTDLAAGDEIHDFLLQEVDRSTPHLAPYEKVKKILVLERDFDAARGEVTPTLKVKRSIVESKHKDSIDRLYQEETC